jgi:hypothetical protein
VLVSIPFPLAETVPALLPLNLATVRATHLVQTLVARPLLLLVDGGTLPCQHTLGSCCLVSQLSVRHQSGAHGRLCNASPSPVLRRCLHQRKANSLFTLAD